MQLHKTPGDPALAALATRRANNWFAQPHLDETSYLLGARDVIRAPGCGNGKHTFDFVSATFPGGLVAHYEADAGEEPSDDSAGDEPSVELAEVYANGMPVLAGLSDALVEEITAAIWAHLTNLRSAGRRRFA